MHEPFIWVQQPEMERPVNVGPLLTVLRQLDAPVNTSFNMGVLGVLKRTLRTLNCTVHDPEVSPPIYLANLYKDLHLLEDAFSQMEEQPV